jgi:hypothetical protein
METPEEEDIGQVAKVAHACLDLEHVRESLCAELLPTRPVIEEP